MGRDLQLFLLFMCLKVFVIAALTDPNDFAALSGLKSSWSYTPPSWSGSDPCGSWEGVYCTNSRVTSIILSGVGLAGILSSDISSLTELTFLDLSQNQGLTGGLPRSIGNLQKLKTLYLVGCNFGGNIPDTMGSLTQLVQLNLASNKFVGRLPPSIGNLSILQLLDITNNTLSGTIPVSDGTSPGLDLLTNAQHFHFGRNQLSGMIPKKLFSSNMALIHVLFDGNQLNGSIPSTLELCQNLEVIRLDRNSLSGPVTLNFSKLAYVSQLYLSNNQLTGPMPDLGGMTSLTYVDMSNNSFDASTIPSWFLSLQLLTSIIMQHTQLQGPFNNTLFSLPQIQSVVLSHNELNGILDIGSNYGSQLYLIDLQNNSITRFAIGTTYNQTLMLEGNPICLRTDAPPQYCNIDQQQNINYSAPAQNCMSSPCSPTQSLSPTCKCAYPVTGTLHFRSVSISAFNNRSYYNALNTSLMETFHSYQLPVDSISLNFPVLNTNDDYLELVLEIFPSTVDRFNQTGMAAILSQLNSIDSFSISYFGPFFFIVSNNDYFAGKGSSHTGMIIGLAVGGSILVLLLVMTAIYAFHQRKRAKRASLQETDPLASWDPNNSGGSRPLIKGVRCFSFEELKRCTDNFSEANIIGSGGYGKVYRGTLSTKELIAIKRAQQDSVQGSAEFKTEIELLSRVHHKNLVSLVGFCYELGEQMLIYEYAANGSLKDSISGKSGIRLNWIKRLKIALDSARGLAYLHELANPPIIHRDVKPTNILLDHNLTAKVADFGLSKLLGDSDGHVSTEVKGTMGYLDPEYYMTQHLTDKSDVYSFGVVMLELVTGRKPLEHGRYIVKEVKMVMDKTKQLYNLHEILDPTIGQSTTHKGLERFVDLAMRCVQDLRVNRPTMNEVVKEIENILQLAIATSDGNAEMVFLPSSNSGTSQGSFYHPYDSKVFFEYSGSFPRSEIELQYQKQETSEK